MASHTAALAYSRIPTKTRLPSKNSSHSFPAHQCFSKKLEVAEFSGLRSSGCVTFAQNARESNFFDVISAQLTPKVHSATIIAEDVNAAFRKAAEGPLKGVLDVCDAPLVSVDFRCSDVSSTIDSSLTMVMGDDMVKVVAS